MLANESLMAALEPLGKRKEDFREAVATIRTMYRPEVSNPSGVTIAGARFLVVSATKGPSAWPGSVFESADGDWFQDCIRAYPRIRERDRCPVWLARDDTDGAAAVELSR